MKQAKLLVLGGCHVDGYPVGAEWAFPTLLNQLVQGQIVGQFAHVRFVDLPQRLTMVDELRPTHVVLQLGNFEFTDSCRQLLRQGGLRLSSSKSKPTSKSTSASAAFSAEEYTPPSQWRSWVRSAGMETLLLSLWLVRKTHRRNLRALRECMRQHPSVTFVFISPLPSLNPTLNRLRRLGNWLLQQSLPAQPNLHWLDSHQLLPPRKEFFVDSAHLSKQAHHTLAYGLAATLSSVDNLIVRPASKLAVHAPLRPQPAAQAFSVI